MYAGDTIAAIATPPGQGGIGIVRVSGPGCVAIADLIFARAHSASGWAPHRLYHGRIVDDAGRYVDEGLAVCMHGPHSYTGEDILELHCHGSPVVLRRVLARVLSCGARLAEPGEFTRRAFLNGRIDLAQAEAVIDMVRARTSGSATLAADQLCGHLSGHLAELRTELIRLKAMLEAQIDFSEEDFALSPAELLVAVDACIVPIHDFIQSYGQGRVLRDGVRVAIIGKPNVGKSSLLNALLGTDRAIVTPLAGTTRDTVEELADLDGIPVLLSDTAGLRDIGEADPVERLGMERTAATLAQSDLLLTVVDASSPLDARDAEVLRAAAGSRQIVVLNKIDLPQRACESDIAQLANGHPHVSVSAKEGNGLRDLRRCLVDQITGGAELVKGTPVLTNVRHADALTKASASLALARQSICESRPPELVAVDVQDAIDHIGTVTGAITSEEVLDKIFSEFCIGK